MFLGGQGGCVPRCKIEMTGSFTSSAGVGSCRRKFDPIIRTTCGVSGLPRQQRTAVGVAMDVRTAAGQEWYGTLPDGCQRANPGTTGGADLSNDDHTVGEHRPRAWEIYIGALIEHASEQRHAQRRPWSC